MEENKKKRSILYAVIAIGILLVAVIGATYAYFASTITNNANVIVNGHVENATQLFNSYSTRDILFDDITAEDMAYDNNGLLQTQSAVITVEYTSGSEALSACTYDLVFNWDEGYEYTPSANRGDALEVSYEIAGTGGASSVEESQIKTGIILDDEVITSKNGIKSVNEYTVTMRFYNLTTVQNELGGKTYSGKWEINDVVCGFDVNNKNLASEIMGKAIPEKDVNSITMTQAIVVDENGDYRYIGTNPDNYVKFNDELWRIIGVFSDNTHGKTGQKLVKIIRNESLGNMHWNDDESNNWTISSLKNKLNDDTYPYAANPLVETVTWHLGGTDDYDSSSTGLSSHWYNYERGTLTYDDNPTTWEGKVGLMYPSDYGYASMGNSTTSRDACLGEELSNWIFARDCYTTSWLHDSSNHLWGMTPIYFDVYSLASLICKDGYVTGDEVYYQSYGVKPSLYLVANTSIASGTGTQADPYQLSL